MAKMDRTDRELVDEVVGQDEKAFACLFDRYRAAVHAHALKIVRDAAAADDIVQEGFLRLWRRADQWTGQGPFRAWLLRIATNLAFNHLRSARRRREQPIVVARPLEDDDDDERTVPSWMIDASTRGPDEVLEKSEQRRLLRQFVDGLSEEKQEVFRMVHDEEMETREVVEKLGIPEGTVKSRIHHARKTIIREWRELRAEWEDD